MKKIIFLLLMLPLVAACNGKAIRKSLTTSECLNPPHSLPEVQGYTATAIAYGDSYLAVIPISKVRRNSEFRFILTPKPRSDKDPEYEAAWVSISGVNAATNAPASWLTVSGQITNNLKTLTACVPNLTVGDRYKYKVTISDKPLTDSSAKKLGYIDPRADIVPD